jgi:hypothetical protein
MGLRRDGGLAVIVVAAWRGRILTLTELTTIRASHGSSDNSRVLFSNPGPVWCVASGSKGSFFSSQSTAFTIPLPLFPRIIEWFRLVSLQYLASLS